MKIRAFGMLLALAMVLGLAAVPAGANPTGVSHVGVFTGDAAIGKTETDPCDNSGVSTVAGGSLGLPALNGAGKHLLYWSISNGAAVDFPLLQGTVALCGKLTDPADLPLGGASCISTKGYDGKGKASFAGGDIWLSNIGWKNALGGTLLVQGHAGSGKGSKTDWLIAIVQVGVNDIACAEKTVNSSKPDGSFKVAAAYTIIANGAKKYSKKSK